MSRDFPVTGVAELFDVLDAMGARLKSQGVRSALTAAARPITLDARARARKKSGKMAKSIKTGSPRRTEEGNFSVSIRLSGKNAYLGQFHEFGTVPHLIARTGKGEGRVAIRNAKSGTGSIQGGVMKIGPDFVSGIIEHPGHKASPFMRPALDAKADEAVAAFTVRLREFIENKSGYVAGFTEDEAA